MNIRKIINRIFRKSDCSKEPTYIEELRNVPKSDFERFKDWLNEQNYINGFALKIKDGTTVYFSDDFADDYDLKIIGEEKSNNTIIVQIDFLEIAVKTWRKMECEVWYLDNKLRWLIVDNEKGRKYYKSNDLIKSERMNFQFKLEQVK